MAVELLSAWLWGNRILCFWINGPESTAGLPLKIAALSLIAYCLLMWNEVCAFSDSSSS